MKLIFPAAIFLSVLSQGVSKRSQVVLKYDHSIDLEEVAAAVNAASAQVERQLVCTRGLLINVDAKGQQFLERQDGMSVVPKDEAHAVNQHRQLNGVYTPQGDAGCDYQDTCNNLNPVHPLTEQQVQIIKDEIVAELNRGESSFDGSLADNAGAIVRLVFHDAASFDRNDAANLSGLNGCVNKNNDGNAGLHNVQDWLMQLQDLVYSEHDIQITISDLTVLAAITALEVTTEVARAFKENFGVPYLGELDVQFKYGRPDIACGCEEDFLPPAMTSDGSLYNFRVLDETMSQTMGFTRKETAALMGAHTLGGLSVGNSGHPAFFQQTEGAETSAWVFPFLSVSNNDGFDN